MCIFRGVGGEEVILIVVYSVIHSSYPTQSMNVTFDCSFPKIPNSQFVMFRDFMASPFHTTLTHSTCKYFGPPLLFLYVFFSRKKYNLTVVFTSLLKVKSDGWIGFHRGFRICERNVILVIKLRLKRI